MAEKLNKVGVRYLLNKMNGFFAKQTDLTALSTRVDGVVAEGGEPNTIEAVKVNGTALTPDAQKAVDVTVPTKVSDLTNDGDGTTGSEYATKTYVDTNGGKIDKVKVNGAEQTITNKEVDISVPTKLSDLTNDGDGTSGSTFPTTADMNTAISSAVSSAYKYKGSVADMAALNAVTGQAAGDVYDVQATGMNYAWNGTAWDALGQYVDTSLLWSKAELAAITTAEIDEIWDSVFNPSSGS